MRYLIARNDDGTGLVGSARSLQEARDIAGKLSRSEERDVFIMDHRTGKVRTVRRQRKKKDDQRRKGGRA